MSVYTHAIKPKKKPQNQGKCGQEIRISAEKN
jgi:hypothetical protein